MSDFSYGDSQLHIQTELADYAKQNGYPISHFADSVCICGQNKFVLFVDDTEGVAVLECSACQNEHAIGDSAKYLSDADLDECECPCGLNIFEITVGVALYEGSEDVRWIYVGCRCPECRITACYADWKSESGAYVQLLKNV